MIMLTHQAHESDIQAALAEINLLDEVFEKPVLFRIEDVQ